MLYEVITAFSMKIICCLFVLMVPEPDIPVDCSFITDHTSLTVPDMVCFGLIFYNGKVFDFLAVNVRFRNNFV